MNTAEINTLLSAKVDPKKIRLAIMAGKLQGIMNAADRTIHRAQEFNENANWTEMLRIMEGTLGEAKDYRGDHEDLAEKPRYCKK